MSAMKYTICQNKDYVLYNKFTSFPVCLSVCLSVRNRLPNYAYYDDENFTGDSMGLE